MRKLKRAVAREYAQSLGIDHPNKWRALTKTVVVGEKERKISMPARSKFSALWRQLISGPGLRGTREIRKIEEQRAKNQKAAAVLATQRKLKRQNKLHDKARKFPRACGLA